MGNLLHLRHRADLAAAGFYILCLILILSVWLGIKEYMLILNIAHGVALNEAAAREIDGWRQMLFLVRRGVIVFIAIVFLIWFYRAFKNLVLGGVSNLRFSPAWAVGGFFIPFAFFVIPYMVMSELWKGSFALVDEGSKATWRDRPLGGNVVSWWALFLLMAIGSGVTAQYSIYAKSIDSLLIAAVLQILFDIVSLAAAIFTILVIREVTARQSQIINLQQPLI
jgi:hypothetical protein